MKKLIVYVVFQTQMVPIEKEFPNLRYQFSKLTDSEKFIK